MKIREVLRSDLIHIPALFFEWTRELDSLPYPYQSDVSDYSLYLLQRVQEREGMENRGMRSPWNIFVAIPQGNVAKGFIEVEVQRRFYGKVSVIFKVLNFAIDRKSRGLGISKELFGAAMKWEEGFGAQAIEVIVPARSNYHKFWAAAGARTFSTNLVFAKENWELFKEGEFEWANHHMYEDTLIGSSEIKTPKAPQESTEIRSKEKPDLTLAKG
jgi:GNAT superfamily N-acetyltransferase